MRWVVVVVGSVVVAMMVFEVFVVGAHRQSGRIISNSGFLFRWPRILTSLKFIFFRKVK